MNDTLLRKLEQRFVVVESGCWQWIGSLTAGGYGRMTVSPEGHLLGHRAMYAVTRGPIPEGMEIDHLCRNTACVNPDHLEVVTHQENMHRSDTVMALNAVKTHCKRGHEFTPENTYVWRAGKPKQSRICRTCQYDRRKERERRARGS